MWWESIPHCPITHMHTHHVIVSLGDTQNRGCPLHHCILLELLITDKSSKVVNVKMRSCVRSVECVSTWQLMYFAALVSSSWTTSSCPSFAARCRQVEPWMSCEARAMQTTPSGENNDLHQFIQLHPRQPRHDSYQWHAVPQRFIDMLIHVWAELMGFFNSTIFLLGHILKYRWTCFCQTTCT